jgi:hypothetical protein
MKKLIEFKKRNKLEWQGAASNSYMTLESWYSKGVYVPKRDYLLNEYSEKYSEANVSIVESDERHHGYLYFYVNIKFKNKTDEAEFMLRESI